MRLGYKIKELRKSKSWNAEKLAELTEISPGTIYRYERGEVEQMPLRNLYALSEVLEVSIPELLDENNSTVITGDNNILNGMSGSIGGSVTIGDSGQTKEQATEGLANQASDALVQEKMLELLTDIAASVKGIEDKL